MANKKIVRSDYDIEVTMSRMKELRLAAGLTQDKLGDLLNVPRTYISKWERRKSNPGYEHLVRLYRILHGIVVE